MTLPVSPLLGIDVGFSKHRPTTGIAWCIEDRVEAIRTYSDWERRRRQLPDIESFSLIAIDGPLLPAGSDEGMERQCERIFIRGAFQKRCKPGLSHFGAGLSLRKAARDTAEQFKHLVGPNLLPAKGPHVITSLPIVEAFPNAFIGTMLSNGAFSVDKALKRKKFDWLYGHAIRERVFERLLAHIDWRNDVLLHRLSTEHDHEKRAALVCLLTAACAALGQATVIGEQTGGYFWLPPRQIWNDWALIALG
jgi:hypothetical protein